MRRWNIAKRKLAIKRIIVGWIALYPTLLIILKGLHGYTKSMPMPVAVLVEVLVIVPTTQLIAFPLANRLFAGWLAE